jgi:hypothetical protein
MTRREFVLAVLAVSDGAVHSPVQVQKMFFMMDKKISERVGGPYFAFTSGNYGPYDDAVHDELKALEQEGLVEIYRDLKRSWQTYRVTPEGLRQGKKLLASLDPQVADYIQRLSNWVLSMPLPELVGWIYREYPEMKVNSAFRD